MTSIFGDDFANTLQGGAGRDLIYGYDPAGPQGEVSSITATRVATGLAQPLFAVSPPGDAERLFVVQKGGLIRILDLASGQVLAAPFLDVTAQIQTTGERGLLGLAFHPEFAQNGFFYVNLINANGDTEIRRYHVSAADANLADAASGTLVLEIDQPTGPTNHKAGWLGFGPDGYLYAALGDGGPGGDPDNNAQNMESLLGKMLRLDVDADGFPADLARNYAIPVDNPFVGTAGADEIWALGLRNPWRSSFDRATGDLYIADVGQGVWEEVDLGASGANYGWDLREGPAPFNGGSTPAPVPFTEPIHAYQLPGGQAITGGYVYRGTGEGLHGQYFFADFVTGRIFTLRQDDSVWTATERTAQISVNAGAIGNVSSFGEDGLGNLYVVDYSGGELFRLTPQVDSADQSDLLRGGGGDDMLFGGSGDDSLIGNLGADFMVGGRGDDIYSVDNPGDLAAEAPGEGRDQVNSSLSCALWANLEDLTLTGTSPINGTGNALANRITGNSGVNWLDGGAGADDLRGGLADDTLIGGAGADRLNGGTGADLMTGGADNDIYIVENPDDVVNELAGGGTADKVKTSVNYTLAAGLDVEYLMASPTNIPNIELTGNELANRIYGGDGNDLLDGGAGDDKIGGGDDNDTIIGGAGRDLLTGDAGADTFVYEQLSDSGLTGTTRDQILDFVAGSDKIDLSLIDAVTGGLDDGFNFVGSGNFQNAGDLRAYAAGANTIVAGDVDGGGMADFQILLRGNISLSAIDFVL